MKPTVFIFSFLALGFLQFVPLVAAQELDGSDLNRELNQRNARIAKLTLEEQLQLRAAQTKATEDPEVKEALRKRNEAIEAFRAAVRAGMLKADPTVGPILEKVAIRPTPSQ